MQRDRGIFLGVQLELRAEVVAGKHVAVQHDHRVVRAAAQARGRVADAAAGAERYLLLDVLKLQPERGPVAEPLGEHRRAIRGGQHHPGDPGRSRTGQLMREERYPGRRQQRLWRGYGQRAQPGALPADQQDCLYPGSAAGTGG